jgi:hypothetical protein
MADFDRGPAVIAETTLAELNRLAGEVLGSQAARTYLVVPQASDPQR